MRNENTPEGLGQDFTSHLNLKKKKINALKSAQICYGFHLESGLENNFQKKTG